eukprot:3900562-Alexandrium_andersonii.AAC.1
MKSATNGLLRKLAHRNNTGSRPSAAARNNCRCNSGISTPWGATTNVRISSSLGTWPPASKS